MKGPWQATTTVAGVGGESPEDQAAGAGRRPRRPSRLSLRAGAVLSLAAGALLLPGQVPRAAASTEVYVVQPGDTLWHIALTFGTTVEALAAANGLGNPSRLVVGQTLLVADASAPGQGAALPTDSSTAPQTYVVQPGDTLSSIAQRLGVSPAALAAANGLADANRVIAGQALRVEVSGATASVTAAEGTGATYVVQPGDTLSAIAFRLGMTPQALAAANGLADPGQLRVGQVLAIGASPVASESGATPAAAAPAGGAGAAAPAGYVVQPGDTLSAIAQRLGVTPDALAAANGLADANHLVVGQTLAAPGGAPAAGALPSPATTAGSYVVQPGDTLSSIGLQLAVPPGVLAAANGIDDARLLRVGQVLQVPPAAMPATTPAPLGAPQVEVMVDKATVQGLLEQAAAAAGVDSALVKAVAWQESGWQMVTAADGGVGVMQLMPYTTAWLNQAILPAPIDPYVVADNVRAGVALLRYQLDSFAGDVRLAVAAYHQGQASVRAQGLLPETEHYVSNVLALRQRFTQ